MKIDTNGKDFIAGGNIYVAGKDGTVDVPDDVLAKDKIGDSNNSGMIEPDEIVTGLRARIEELEKENEKLKAENAELAALFEEEGTDEKAELLAKAKELGIAADKRWGIEKLKSAIAEKSGA